MDRRRFLKLFGGAASVAVAAPLIPFGRVWSFPSKIVIAKSPEILAFDPLIGSMVRIRIPQRFPVRDYFREHDQLTEILKVGDVFTIAGINKINPPRRFDVRDRIVTLDFD